MNYFILNNKNSLFDMNIGIIGNSTRPRPQEVVEKEEVEGRKQGSLIYKTGAYKDIIIKRKLRLLSFNNYEVETLRIMNWLTNIEDNRLIFKDYTEKCYKVKYVEIADFEDYRGGNVDFDATFHCEPFLYNTNEPDISISNGDLILNDGFIEADPTIKLVLPSTPGNIQITIGSKSLTLNNVKGEVIIEPQRAICEGIEVRTIGEFPVLTEGYNIVSWVGNINSFKINKNLLYRG